MKLSIVSFLVFTLVAPVLARREGLDEYAKSHDELNSVRRSRRHLDGDNATRNLLPKAKGGRFTVETASSDGAFQVVAGSEIVSFDPGCDEEGGLCLGAVSVKITGEPEGDCAAFLAAFSTLTSPSSPNYRVSCPNVFQVPSYEILDCVAYGQGICADDLETDFEFSLRGFQADFSIRGDRFQFAKNHAPFTYTMKFMCCDFEASLPTPTSKPTSKPTPKPPAPKPTTKPTPKPIPTPAS